MHSSDELCLYDWPGEPGKACQRLKGHSGRHSFAASAPESDPEAESEQADATNAGDEQVDDDGSVEESTQNDAAPEPEEDVCPKCGGDLVKHGDANPHKAGASHCNKCGECWEPGLAKPRYAAF